MNLPYYDTLEIRDPAAREAALMAALPAQVAHAQYLHAQILGQPSEDPLGFLLQRFQLPP